MSIWSVFRRSSPSIGSFAAVQRSSFRQFATVPPHGELSHLRNSCNGDEKTNLLKWISVGMITSSTLAFSLYAFPPSAINPSTSISYADSSTSPSALSDRNRSKFLFGDAYRKKVFFNYERRIRMRSPPEKVFSYFASVHASDGETFMTPADLMRALVPVFPPSESHRVRDGHLRGEKSPGELHCAPSQFFMLFDTNNDGLISFKEYLFFVTLLSIPESSFSVAFKMFDVDCSGEIDREEFKNVMNLMRAHNRQGALHRDGIRVGHNLGGSVENGGLVEYFFGTDGKRRLKLDDFSQFLRDLHSELVNLEFAHYDCKSRGTISAKDFGLSMVASADMKNLNKLLDRVDELDDEPHLNNIRITPEDFKNFAELRLKLQPLSLALFSFGQINGLLTKKDLQRAAEQVCGISLTDNVVEIIFHVFDTNRDGSLSSEEFVRVLHKRERDIGQPVEAGIFSFFSCCWNCTKSPVMSRLIS